MKMVMDVMIESRTVTDAVIENAVEGLKYWCDAFRTGNSRTGETISFEEAGEGLGVSWFILDHMGANGRIWLHSRKDGRWRALTHRKVVSGIKRYIKRPTAGDFLEFADHKLWADLTYIDDDVADACVQYAMFGKILYD